jgi:hypothetical protein
MERAYYHCQHCHQGHCPSDAVRGLSAAETTPGALEVISMAGVLASFAHAAEDVLRRLAGLRGHRDTPDRDGGQGCRRPPQRRLSLRPGHALGLAQGCRGKDLCLHRHRRHRGPQQGPKAAAAEGKMATLAMVYNPVPEDRRRWARSRARRPPWQVRYPASLHSQAGLGNRCVVRRPRWDRSGRAPACAFGRRGRAGSLAAASLRPGGGGDFGLPPTIVRL